MAYNNLRDWGRVLVDYANGYIMTRSSSLKVYREMRLPMAEKLPPDERIRAEALAKAELDEAVELARRELWQFCEETYEAFASRYEDQGLRGSFFDMMTEVRETPANAENSLRDFLARSGEIRHIQAKTL